MWYDDYPTTEDNGDSNGNFLQDGSTIVSATTPSSQQTQTLARSRTFPKLPPTHTHALNPTRAKDCSGRDTPTNRLVLTMQTSSGTKKSGKGQCASAAGMKSPSSSVTPALLRWLRTLLRRHLRVRRSTLPRHYDDSRHYLWSSFLQRTHTIVSPLLTLGSIILLRLAGVI
ncbi:hypothetical protein K503DRAFT_295899 [Rhizopogon vinicolor AM-OR11-026]|uniref:Uncharacterized protein n=1 Tax=Rhizopogon vinicolor AM-OR11-026 TaxID=1314800 RepID=A0A1B7MV62_9AGAM|nr:hypothetical protein K503DRAFT_295899 [Rhizopogon vinicolor AM-OR11-026]